MYFDHLPDEIILQIFGSFSLEQLLTTLRLVNRRWKRIADDDSHYRKLVLNSDVSARLVNHLLRKYHLSIKHLHLYERRDINDLAPYIQSCSNLESLTLSLCYGNGDDLVHALRYCCLLTTFTMHHCECLSDVSLLLDVISHHPISKINIRNLQTSDCIQFSNLNSINDFRLKNVCFNIPSIGQFCFSNRDSLTTLKLIPSNKDFSTNNFQWIGVIGENLYDMKWSPQQCIEWMMLVISQCVNLRSICFGPLIARELKDDTIFHLGSLNSLRTLVLFHADAVTDNGFVDLFQRRMATNLTKISLHKCFWVTSSVLRTIASHCLNLEKFTFEKCKHTQTNQDHEDILVLARSNKKLKRLHLFSMDICVAHILHSLPEYLPNLQSLKYSNDSEPMNIPSFLSTLEGKMPNFNVSGLQWKFNLHVNCIKKPRNQESKSAHEYVCAMLMKGQVDYV